MSNSVLGLRVFSAMSAQRVPNAEIMLPPSYIEKMELRKKEASIYYSKDKLPAQQDNYSKERLANSRQS